jgi:hypothetical protein
MKWQRLGRVFEASGQRPWIVSHGSVPTPELIDGSLYRIYFTPRDQKGRSVIAYLVIDINEPTRVLDLSEEPALAPGEPGAFDDSGAMFSWIVRHEGRRWLYYIGWNLGVETPWRTSIGLAYADAKAEHPRFERHSAGPILDRSTMDPFFVTNPFVMKEQNVWRMWYLSGIRWDGDAGRRVPRYNVRYAESSDGMSWRPTGRVCVDHAHPGEVAIGRPFVLKEDGLYKMFYSFRGDTFGYRMGYAESPDGLNWTRRDERTQFEGPAQSWDDQGTAYPTIFDHNGQRYMLYCGNWYSKAGFGIAALVS